MYKWIGLITQEITKKVTYNAVDQWMYDDLLIKHKGRGVEQDYLYGSEHLMELAKYANTKEKRDAIFEHMNMHDTWGIESYDKVYDFLMNKGGYYI